MVWQISIGKEISTAEVWLEEGGVPAPHQLPSPGNQCLEEECPCHRVVKNSGDSSTVMERCAEDLGTALKGPGTDLFDHRSTHSNLSRGTAARKVPGAHGEEQN